MERRDLSSLGFAGFGKHLLVLAKNLSSPEILCSLPFVTQPSSTISTKRLSCNLACQLLPLCIVLGLG